MIDNQAPVWFTAGCQHERSECITKQVDREPNEPMSRFEVPISTITWLIAGANMDDANGLGSARSGLVPRLVDSLRRGSPHVTNVSAETMTTFRHFLEAGQLSGSSGSFSPSHLTISESSSAWHAGSVNDPSVAVPFSVHSVLGPCASTGAEEMLCCGSRLLGCAGAVESVFEAFSSIVVARSNRLARALIRSGMIVDIWVSQPRKTRRGR